MDDFQFQGRGAAAAAAVLPGKVAAGRRAKPAACYDDVFGGQPRSSLVPARPDDYREIFGAAAACSIPVLDLPPPPGDGYELRQCSAPDYLDIFGGFGSGDFAASYQELFASQGSNGIGVPLPSELGYASPVIGGSNSRVLNGMGCEKQEMPASGITIEGPSRDQFGCSLNGVAQHLNDGTNLLKRPNHMASWSNKSDPVDGTIHKNQVHAMPGLAFVVKNTDVDKPQTQVDIDVFFDSNCSSEVPEQHLKKAMLSTSSCSDVKCSENDMKDEQRPTNLELSGSMITSSYKENTSYPSKNQSMIPRSNGFSAKVSTHPSPGQNSMEKKTEGKCQNKTVLNSMSASSGNDLKVRCTASEGVPVNEEYLSSSSNGHSASNGTKSSPDHLPDDVTIYAGNIKIAEANHLKKSMPGSPPCTTQNSDDKTADQKKSNPMSNPPKNATINESIHSCSSSTHSVSGLDRSCPDSIFLTISDINLRTQPSQGPPPARPPPARPPSRSDLSGRNLRRTLTDYQKHDVGTGIAYRSHSFKHSMRDSSPPPFDVEVDASSAAAASVAAIKEAMELAQARLKSAKVSRERQKDNLLSRRKLGLNEDLSDLNRDRHQNFQDTQRIREEVFVELAHEKTDDQKNASTAEKMPTAFNPSLPTGDFKEKEKNHESAEVSLPAIHCGESEVSSLTNIKQDKVGEWKVEEQFYEFIQSEEKLKKVPENSLKEDTERRSQTKIGIGGKELNAFELKKCEKLLAATKVVEWEGDNVRPQNCCVTSKEQIEGSQVASLMYNRPENCNLRQKETIDAHLQEKQPGEFQEPLKTEQETKWRTSEEAFICELSEKNLGVSNDASKCKSVYRCQAQEKVHRGTDETSGCEETEKEINVADEYFDGHEEDNIVQGKLSEVVGNKMEANVVLVSNISAKDVHLKTVSKNHGCEIHRVSLNTDEYGCFPEGQEIEPKEASPLFGRGKGNISNSTCQVFEWAVNEDELKAPVNVHDWKDKRDNFNVPQGTNRCSDEANKLNEIQKFAVETEEELQLKTVKLNTSSIAGVKGDFGNETAAALEDCNKKIYENIKEVQVVGSNKIVKPTQNVRKGTGNDKKIEDAQEADSLGEQWHMCKASQMSSGNQDAGMPVENGSCGHETEDIDGDKMEDEQVNDLEEGKEREIRKLEEEIEKKRIELEEKEREKKLEDAKERERISLKEEKEREKKLGEEKERTRLEEERERERKKLEGEREKKMLEDEEREQKLQEEERKRKKLEDEDREKKRLEDEEREKKLEVQERKRKKLEDEEREKKRLEDWEREKNLEEEERKRRNLEDERERKRLEEENERRRSEEEEREWRKCEEAEERRKLEEEKRKLEEERERRKFEEEERERRKTEEKERMRKKQEEEDRERSKLEEKERERRKQEEERERRRLEEIERERRKLEEKVRERQKIEEEKAREKKLDEEREEWRKSEEEKERERKKLEVERDREREREKDRQAVERATREAHERAFIEARERAERVAVERITAEARQRALAEARERAEKSSAEALEKYMAEKVSREARLRSERAAVERATAEARERAAEKAAQDARERAEKLATASREGVRQNFSNVRDFDPQFQNVGPSNSSYQKYSDSSHNASFMNEKFRGSEGESAIRCKARMERHQRTFERAAKALAEKNLRDIIAQREQAERHRLAETLDADVKRWSNGKEGNLRALLSTLQYILGPESGWQPIPLTDVVTAPAVKKAYRKATLCVHPDKLQQRGASIQQKYICEKVFDLLKEAWNKFNSEER